MAFKFNPFTGNFDDLGDLADKVEGVASSTDNAIVRWDGTTGKLVQNSGITIDDSDNMVIAGDLTVNGTTTTVNTSNLDVTDKNITVNNTGNDASAEGAGLTVERTGTDGSLVYEDALTSKWKLGSLGSEVEILDVSSSQTLTNKTINASNNTLTNITNTNIDASASIALSKLATLAASRAVTSDGSGFLTVSAVTSTELGYVSGVTSAIQTQLNAKAIETRAINTSAPLAGGGDLTSDRTLSIAQATNAVDGYLAASDFANFEGKFEIDIVSTSGVVGAIVEKTYLIDTSGGTATITLPTPALNASVTIKDSTGDADVNNITVNPNSGEVIDGASSYIMNSEYESKQFVSNGTDWFIL